MRIHILGICGTFMSGIALIAKQSGHEVTGSDLNVYPPMSTQLIEQGIQLTEGYDAPIEAEVDCVVVGNIIKRGNPAMEYVLNHKIPYVSGPQWLAENILHDKWVLGVSGTHGKTTTTSLLTWILECAGLQPGFLIGGVPENFGISARLGGSEFFVIESDEYDCALFDKRSKFIHYHPKTLIINNLEYDHADIFPDLTALKLQFHYLLRTIPGNGLIVHHASDMNVQEVLTMGCWTPTTTFSHSSGDWQAKLLKPDGSHFVVSYKGEPIGKVEWQLVGNHNIENALAALAAAQHAGVEPAVAISALATFKNVKRRLEVKGKVNDITIYDDFAHHPTAIATTLAGLRAKVGKARIVAVVEFGSYTMRSGIHQERFLEAFTEADMVICKRPLSDKWNIDDVLRPFKQPTQVYDEVDTLVAKLMPQLKPDDHVIIMSNSGFNGVHNKLLVALRETVIKVC